MSDYRKEKYIDYIKINSIGFVLNFKEELPKVLPFIRILMFILFIAKFLVFYLFFLTIHYKVYKSSSRQYELLEKYFIKKTFNVKIKSIVRNRKSKFWNIKFANEGITEHIIFDFDYADVFETANSLFLFPWSSHLGEEIKIKQYHPPIRFNKEEEQLYGMFGIYNISDFTEINKTDKIISFNDQKYMQEISLVFVDYNNSNED